MLIGFLDAECSRSIVLPQNIIAVEVTSNGTERPTSGPGVNSCWCCGGCCFGIGCGCGSSGGGGGCGGDTHLEIKGLQVINSLTIRMMNFNDLFCRNYSIKSPKIDPPKIEPRPRVTEESDTSVSTT